MAACEACRRLTWTRHSTILRCRGFMTIGKWSRRPGWSSRRPDLNPRVVEKVPPDARYGVRS